MDDLRQELLWEEEVEDVDLLVDVDRLLSISDKWGFDLEDEEEEEEDEDELVVCWWLDLWWLVDPFLRLSISNCWINVISLEEEEEEWLLFEWDLDIEGWYLLWLALFLVWLVEEEEEEEEEWVDLLLFLAWLDEEDDGWLGGLLVKYVGWYGLGLVEDLGLEEGLVDGWFDEECDLGLDNGLVEEVEECDLGFGEVGGLEEDLGVYEIREDEELEELALVTCKTSEFLTW